MLNIVDLGIKMPYRYFSGTSYRAFRRVAATIGLRVRARYKVLLLSPPFILKRQKHLPVLRTEFTSTSYVYI